MIGKLKYIILFSILFSVNLIAEEKYHFQKYSLQEGLPQSKVKAIAADKQGYIWLGTMGGGLCRFNGKDFETFSTEQGFPDFSVEDISILPNNNLLVLSKYRGIFEYNGKSFKRLSTNKKDLHISMARYVKDIGVIYSLTKGGLFSLTNLNQIHPTTNIISTLISPISMSTDSAGCLWLNTRKGVFILKNNKLLQVNFKQNPEILHINQNRFIYAIKDSVYSGRIKNNQLIVLNRFSFTSARIKDFYFYQNKGFFIITDGKDLFYKTPDNIKIFNEKNGLIVDQIHKVFVDINETIWIASKGNGLIRFAGDLIAHFPSDVGLNEEDVFVLKQDFKGNLLILDIEGNLFVKSDNNIRKLNNSKPFSGKFFTEIYTGDNEIILGDQSSLFSVSNNFQSLTKITALPTEMSTYRLTRDSKGQLWLASRKNGLYLLNKGKFQRMYKDIFQDGLYLYSILPTSNGDLWIGTNNGAFRCRNNTIKSFGSQMCNSFVGCMTVDERGRVFLGTDRCVSVVDQEKIYTISTDNGLRAMSVYLLCVDKNQNLWVGTNAGVDKVVFNQSGKITSIENYGYSDGFVGIECNSRGALCDRNGNLWFATVGGIMKINKNALFETHHALPKIFITGVRLMFDTINWKERGFEVSDWFGVPRNFYMNAGDNYLVIDYQSVGSTMRNIKFSYRVLGLYTEWCPPTDNMYAVLMNLPSGNYKFQVRAIYPGSNNKNYEVASFSFYKKSYFFLRWWFILLVLILFASVAYSIYRIRKNRILRERRNLEKMVLERTADLKKAYDEKEVLIKEIHHRVKNNLQVVNSLISLQSSYIDDKSALRVLDECKNRIRSISLIHERLYQTNDYKSIDLKSYIQALLQDLLKVYDVHQKITLNVEVENREFSLNTLVPLGLILNEIISNSLKYAFENAGEGLINVKVKNLINDSFELTISDNGCGFNQQNIANKKTLGLTLIHILAEQLDGSIEKIPSTTGTFYKLIFNLQDN